MPIYNYSQVSVEIIHVPPFSAYFHITRMPSLRIMPLCLQLPEVNAAAEEAMKESGQTISILITQNLGMLTGWTIILMLALYAGKINF